MIFALPLALFFSLASIIVFVLHLLRRRRVSMPTSSLLLWRLDAGEVRKRLRWTDHLNLRLLFQVLVVLTLATALAQPLILAPAFASGDRVIIALDLSASMGADGGASFTRARDAALADLGRLPAATPVALVLLADEPRLSVGFSTDRAAVRERILSAEPMDVEASLDELWAFASDLTGTGIAEVQGDSGSGDRSEDRTTGQTTGQTTGRTGRPTELRFYTDFADSPAGIRPDSSLDPSLHSGGLRFTLRRFGTSGENAGIIVFEPRRTVEGYQTLARIAGYGTRSMTAEAVLYLDGVPVRRDSLTLEPGEHRDIFLTLPPDQQAELRLEGLAQDALRADNHAWAVPGDGARRDVVSLGPPNPFLERAISLLPLTSFRYAEDAGSAEGADIVVLDGVQAGRLPAGRYLAIGVAPPFMGEIRGLRSPADTEALSGSGDLLQGLELDGLRIADYLALEPSQGVETQARIGDDPFIARYEDRFYRTVFLAAGLASTNLGVLPAYPILMQRIVSDLAPLNEGLSATRTGSSVQIPSQSGEEFVLQLPDGSARRYAATGTSLEVDLHPAAGVYELQSERGRSYRFAANLASERESRLQDGPGIADTDGPDARVARLRGRHEIWWLFVLVAVALLLADAWVGRRDYRVAERSDQGGVQ